MTIDAEQRAMLTRMETAHTETARHLAVIERQIEARAERMTTSSRVKARQYGRASATWTRSDQRDFQANVTALSNDTALTGADIAAAREDIGFAQSKFEREQQLWKQGFTTKADYDAAQHAVSQAREALRIAQANQTQARAKLAHGAAVPGENPQVAAAEAQAEAAQLNLKRTAVYAPMAGQVAGADNLLPGQQIVQNLPVLTLVAKQGTYVEANFKETQLAQMRVGQPALVEFDAYPDMKLKGHVASIGAGTGSEFSVLPAQNATGNWVKVTQRVPVRIAIDSKPPRPLIAGLTTSVTVYTDGRGK